MKNSTAQVLHTPNLFGQKEESAKTKEKSVKAKSNFWGLAMYISGAFAFVIAGLGLILCGMSHFGFVINAENVNKIGTFMIIFSAPLFFFSAHCMDKLDLRDKDSHK